MNGTTVESIQVLKYVPQMLSALKEGLIKITIKGPGGGTVGRTVASDTRDPWFRPPHQQELLRKLSIAQWKSQKQLKKRLGKARLKNTI